MTRYKPVTQLLEEYFARLVVWRVLDFGYNRLRLQWKKLTTLNTELQCMAVFVIHSHDVMYDNMPVSVVLCSQLGYHVWTHRRL